MARLDANKGNTIETGIHQTRAVGLFPDGASPDGVLDISGNVWEWCLNEANQPDRTQAEGDASRVLCGGSWYFDQNLACAVFRGGDSPVYRSNGLGFRVVACPPLPDRWTLPGRCACGAGASAPAPSFSPPAHCCWRWARWSLRLDWVLGSCDDTSASSCIIFYTGS